MVPCYGPNHTWHKCKLALQFYENPKADADSEKKQRGSSVKDRSKSTSF